MARVPVVVVLTKDEAQYAEIALQFQLDNDDDSSPPLSKHGESALEKIYLARMRAM